MTTLFPKLEKSYKKKFPFKLCTTSFIYPDHYGRNVAMLGAYVDEIELLFFESRGKSSLPSEREIGEIADVMTDLDISCNIHLPLDISLGDSDRGNRRHAVKTVKKILSFSNPLSPTSYTIHFTYEEKERTKIAVKNWQLRVIDSVDEILDNNGSAGIFSVENLDYPFEWAEEIIYRMGLRVCIDIGHFIRRNESFKKTFEKNESITDILHIYGVSGERDHLSLQRLGKNHLRDLGMMLKNFSGTVSLEVFSFGNLKSSLAVLEEGLSRGFSDFHSSL